MAGVYNVFMFAFERARNVALAFAFIVMIKAFWLMLAPALLGS